MCNNGDRVLLIDDEVDYIETLAERLRARGLDVEIATNGQDGIDKAKSKNFHAIILDYAMPGMDGIETLRALRAHNKDIQVMLLSGHATIKTAINATRLGAVDVLEKPTDIATLMEKIRDARAKYLTASENSSQEQVEKILKKHGW